MVRQAVAGEDDAFLEKRAPKKTKMQGCMDFLYNKDTGQVLGRTGKSWALIVLFYIVFYACLAGFFAICLIVFLQTLKPNEPQFYGKGSIIGINPGLGYQPWLKDDPESTLIKFDSSIEEGEKGFEKYIWQLGNLTEKYTKDVKGTRKCTGGASNADKDETDSCQFDLSELGDCSADKKFGFSSGKPCVALTLNRLIDWTPIGYAQDSAPDIVAGRVSGNDIAVNCEGQYAADKDNIGTVEYHPRTGFHAKYYPFRKYENYHQPLVMVQFTGLPKGTLIMVECKAYAYNVIHDRPNKLGMVHFELLVEDGVVQEE